MTVLIAIGSILLVCLLIAVVIRNGIIASKNATKRAWSDVLVQQRKRGTIIPDLERLLKDYVSHESGVLEKVTTLRNALGALDANKIDVSQLGQVQSASRSLTAGLMATVEAYPDLKAADLTGKVMKELTECEENVAAAIGIFNANVENFNNGIQQFPGNLVNGAFNKEPVLNTFTDSAAAAAIEFQPNL